MILDLIETIINFGGAGAYKCILLDKHTHDNINIYFLDARNTQIDQQILKQKKYLNLKRLYSNDKIYDLNHLQESLIELDCSGIDSSITQNSIVNLKNLKILRCRDNVNIKNLDMCRKSIYELDCSGQSGICQCDLYDLTYIKNLNCFDNPNIHDLNILTTLEKLNCGGKCGVKLEGIMYLLNIKKIQNDPYMEFFKHIFDNNISTPKLGYDTYCHQCKEYGRDIPTLREFVDEMRRCI